LQGAERLGIVAHLDRHREREWWQCHLGSGGIEGLERKAANYLLHTGILAARFILEQEGLADGPCGDCDLHATVR
jgi:hypothetical protein